jgi:hypothetical protein
MNTVYVGLDLESSNFQQDAGSRLEGCAQPLCHHLRKPAAGVLGAGPNEEMRPQRQNRPMETVDKQTPFFHRSHSPYCC